MELKPADRWEWERIIRRIIFTEPAVMLVALVLATYGDPDGTRVKPGAKRVIRVTPYKRATVLYALSKLREMGLLERVTSGSEKGRKDAHDEYRLTIPVDILDRYPMLSPDED